MYFGVVQGKVDVIVNQFVGNSERNLGNKTCIFYVFFIFSNMNSQFNTFPECVKKVSEHDNVNELDKCNSKRSRKNC